MEPAPLSSEQITKTSGSNFVSSFWFLPKQKRQALNVIYAYCRLTDDIVDLARGGPEKQNAQKTLDNWRKETVKSFKNGNDTPVLKELSGIVRQYQIPQDYFHQLIDGVQMDLEKNSYKTFEELYTYCYRVASVVGLICLKIFGYRNLRTKDYAVNLGVAFQMTNILRDLKTDAESGRVYLPEQDLEKFSLKRQDILRLSSATTNDSAFKRLIDFECQRAEYFYKKAKENLTKEDRPNLTAAEVMCAVYHAILEKIKKVPLVTLRAKVRLSRLELACRILQGWARNRLAL